MTSARRAIPEHDPDPAELGKQCRCYGPGLSAFYDMTGWAMRLQHMAPWEERGSARLTLTWLGVSRLFPV